MNTINKYGIACMYTITLCTLRGHSCTWKYVRNKNAVDNQFYLLRGTQENLFAVLNQVMLLCCDQTFFWCVDH